MSVPAWRTVGYAALIAAGLWFAFAGSVVAAAQPSDTDATDRGATRSTPTAESGSAVAAAPQSSTATRPGWPSRSATEARRDRIRSGSSSIIRLGRADGRVPDRGIEVSPNGIRVSVGAQQVRISGAYDEPVATSSTSAAASAGVTAAQSSGGAAAPSTFAATGAGASGAQSAGRRATFQLVIPQAPHNRGAGATPPPWQPLLTTVAIEVSTGATVRGTLQPQLEAEAVLEPVSVPAPAPPDPEPDVDSRPPPVLEGRPAPPGPERPPPGLESRPPSLGVPPVVEGRPGLGVSPPPAAPPPAVAPPAAPPPAPAPESPPVEPPVIDVAGPAVGGGGGGGGGGVDASVGSSPQPIRAPLAIPAPRIGAPGVPARPLLPVTPPGAAAQPLAPPAGASGVAPRSGPGATNPAPQAPRGTTPAAPVQVSAGQPVARTDVHRLGYPQYLRSARGTQVAAVALPGVAGLLLLTVSGGVVGYRQASAGRMVRVSAAQRFLP